MSLTFEVVIKEANHTLSTHTANMSLSPPIKIWGWIDQKFGQVWLFFFNYGGIACKFLVAISKWLYFILCLRLLFSLIA